MSEPFISIRTPAKPDPYQRALELSGQVHRLLEHTPARFHLADRLDRAATNLALELARAAAAAKYGRWRRYRHAEQLATDVATMLDVMAHQQTAPSEELSSARKLVRELLAELTPLANG